MYSGLWLGHFMSMKEIIDSSDPKFDECTIQTSGLQFGPEICSLIFLFRTVNTL